MNESHLHILDHILTHTHKQPHVQHVHLNAGTKTLTSALLAILIITKSKLPAMSNIALQ